MSDQPLAGKVALITGASRGIGAAIAERLARDGASVVITYAGAPEKAGQVVRSIEASGTKALALKADASDESAVRAAIQRTISVFGALDILVNNAGIVSVAPIDQIKTADFDRMLAVNVRGLFIATQEAVRHMKDGGRIIHIGSCNSDRVPFQGGSVYALTKAAIVGFTKGLARDLGPRGITVNNIQPGPTNTDMNPADGPAAPGTRANVALQRYAEPREIADFVAFIAGPSSSFITGASLSVDGGYAA